MLWVQLRQIFLHLNSGKVNLSYAKLSTLKHEEKERERERERESERERKRKTNL
jgi:hypothetical protein